jgi:hypothetical protein
MSGTHENAVDRTRLYAERTKHALGIVNRKTRYRKPFALSDPFFTDINAVYRTGFRTLVTGNTSG